MKNWPAKHRVTLSKSFRFGQAVADEANVLLGLLDAPLRIEGAGPESTVGFIDTADADAVLCRTNAAVIQTALDNCYHRRVGIVGGTTAIRKFAEAAEALIDGRRAAWHPELGIFKSWGAVLDYVNNDGGSDLRSMVNIITDYGVETIYEVCDNSASEDKADLIISTAHKAKGREWDRVIIASDFQPSVDPETGEQRQAGRAELMLMYVAVTRARKALDCSALAFAKGA
jgi:hypothetical protein